MITRREFCSIVASGLAFPAFSKPAARTSTLTRSAGGVLTHLGVNVRLDDINSDLLTRAVQLGVKWLRTDVRWARIERTIGTFDFGAEEHAFGIAQRMGFKVLGILDYGHPLLTRGFAPQTATQSNQFASFAKVAEEKLGKLVNAWEVWNEPNHPRFWPPAPEPERFLVLLRSTANAIWTSNPDRQLVVGGLSGVDLEFLRRLSKSVSALAATGPIAFSVHPYRSTNPETLFDDCVKARLIDSQGRLNLGGVPIWISEWGYCRHAGAAGEAGHAEMVARIPLVAASLGVPVTILYELVDGGRDSNGCSYGLLEAPTLRSYGAFQGLIHARPILEGFEARPGLTRVSDGWMVKGHNSSVSWGTTQNALLCQSDLRGTSVRLNIGGTEICYVHEATE